MVCLGWTCNTKHPSFPFCLWKKAACGFAVPGDPSPWHTRGPSPRCFALLAFCLPQLVLKVMPEHAVRYRAMKKGQLSSAGFFPAQPRLWSQKAGWICNQHVQLADTGRRGSAGARGAFGVRAALYFILCSRVAWELAPTPCHNLLRPLCHSPVQGF